MQSFLGPASWLPCRVRIPATPRPLRRKTRPTLEFLERREVLSTFRWTGNAGNGSWDTAGNWEANQAPTTGSADIIFPTAATPQTISLPFPHSELNITSLTVQGGSYTLQGPAADAFQKLNLAEGAAINTQASGSSLAIAPGHGTALKNSLSLNFLGSVTKSGPGALVLNSDVYFYATPGSTLQPLHVSAGDVNLGASTNLFRSSFQIDAGARVLVGDGYRPEMGSLSGGGTLQIGVSSDPASTGVDLNTPQGVSDRFSGVIDGSGGLIAMVGLGSNTIGSINPDGTGTFDISVASGSVFVSNTLKVRQLNVFGLAGQIATFGGPSTMTVWDVATLNSSSTFNVALNGTGAGQSTQLNDTKLTGNPVNLGGSTLSVSLGYTPNAGDTFTIISAGGGITGQFSNITDGQILTVNQVDFRYRQTSTAATLTALPWATTTTLASSANPSIVGANVSFTATVAPSTGTGTPTGTVTFKDGATTLGTGPLNGSGVATLDITDLSVATHNITAVYGGDTNYVGSTSSAVTQTVRNFASTTSLVSSSPGGSAYGQTVTFAATVTSSGSPVTVGTVTFYADSVSISPALPLSGTGTATFDTASLLAGTRSITAVYNGTINYVPSTSNSVDQTVNQATTMTSLVSSASSGITYGQTVTFTATVTGSVAPVTTATVTFYAGGVAISPPVSLSGTGTATFNTSSLPVGTSSITAVYSGDTNHSTSTSAVVGQVVNSKPVATSPTVTLAKVLFTQKTNKKGKPVGKPVFAGFQFNFSTAMDSVSAGNAGNYKMTIPVTKRVGKKRVTVQQSIGFTASLSASGNVVLKPLGKQTFPKGGQINLKAGGLKSTAGAFLAGRSTFNISKGAKSIS